MLAHVVILEAVGWWILYTYGTSWSVTLFSCLFFVTAQAQAGWLQHDLGHLSVFEGRETNLMAHKLVIGFLKAASSNWWNWRHFQHHSKPNIIRMDPDVKMAFFFLIGDVMPVQWGKKKKGHNLYRYQHRYWFLIGPPFLLPVYFHMDVIARVVATGDLKEAAWILSFFARWFYLGAPLYGGGGYGVLATIGLYFLVRTIESHWFVWVTQMSHIPKDIHYHESQPWVESQLSTTCNVEQSAFNDWFTGHLNFQIEHHLFPTMPRHNLYKVAPRVKALCEKHGHKYESKTLYRAFADIVEMLQHSGELWYEAYHLDVPAPNAPSETRIKAE